MSVFEYKEQNQQKNMKTIIHEYLTGFDFQQIGEINFKDEKSLTEEDTNTAGKLLECINLAYENDDDANIEDILIKLNNFIIYSPTEGSKFIFSEEFGYLLGKLVTKYFGTPQIIQTVRLIGNLMISNSSTIEFFYVTVGEAIVNDILDTEDDFVFIWEIRVLSELTKFKDENESLDTSFLIEVAHDAACKNKDIIYECTLLLINIVTYRDYKDRVTDIFDDIISVMLNTIEPSDSGYVNLIYLCCRIINDFSDNMEVILSKKDIFCTILSKVVEGRKIEEIESNILIHTFNLLNVLMETTEPEICSFFFNGFNLYNIFAALHHPDTSVSCSALIPLKTCLMKLPEEFKAFINSIGLYEIIHFEYTFKQKEMLLSLLTAMYIRFRKELCNEYIDFEFIETFCTTLEEENEDSKQVYQYIQTLLMIANDAKVLGIFDKFMESLANCDALDTIKEIEDAASDDLATLVTEFLTVVQGDEEEDED